MSYRLSTGPQILYSDFSSCEECEGVNIVYNDKKEIVFITIDLLIEKIAVNKTFDADCSIKDGFIRHYSKFISTELLIDKLLNAFDYYMNIYYFDEEAFKNSTVLASSHGLLPKGLILFLNKIILKKYEKEISKNPETKNKLKGFYLIVSENTLFKTIFEDIHETMLPLFDLNNEDELHEYLYQQKGRKCYKFFSIKNMREGDLEYIHEGQFNIDDWSPYEIAVHLTSITVARMNKIEEKEFEFGNYLVQSKKELAPNIIALIERFDKLSYFVIEEILSYDKKSKRAQAIEIFIDIAYELKRLHNYNDCLNIQSSLNHFIIKSLTKTWKLVGDSYKKKLAKLDDILSITKGFFNIKQKIKKSIKCKRPYIPYLGLILKEMTFLEEGSKYVHKENMMINISKIVQINKKIDEFFQYRENCYLIAPMTGLEILEKIIPKNEKDLEELGKKLEPTFTRAIKKQYVKRHTNSDLLHTANVNFGGCISLKRSNIFQIRNYYYYD